MCRYRPGQFWSYTAALIAMLRTYFVVLRSICVCTTVCSRALSWPPATRPSDAQLPTISALLPLIPPVVVAAHMIALIGHVAICTPAATLEPWWLERTSTK